MGNMKVQGVRVRLDVDERVEALRTDLERAKSSFLRQAALTDGCGDFDGVRACGNSDGWVNEVEVQRSMGLNASTPFDYHDFALAVQRKAFGAVATERLRGKAETTDSPSLPRPLAKTIGALANKSRADFVPLAEYLAHAFARADSYDSSYGLAGDRVYFFDADALMRGRRVEEVAAACAILTKREGYEVALTRGRGGHYFMVLGQPERVELLSDVTGLDSIFHTHCFSGADFAQPSGGDLATAASADPDHRGAAVSEDGWMVGYKVRPGVGHTIKEPRRLWQAAP